jgi:glycogen(starch) synthase
MRILMVSWEYPPLLVGGLGRHVHALSTGLVRAGHEVTVVTRQGGGQPAEEDCEGVRIVRAAEDPPLFSTGSEMFLSWTIAVNHSLTRTALRVARTGDFDVVHAHDWLVAHTAIAVKEHAGLPLVATIHATEAGRHQGWLPGDMNRCIHSVECWLAQEACRVVVCSAYMRWEANRLLGLGDRAIDIVPNGVDAAGWRSAPRAVAAARARYAGDGPLLAFAGRLVYEKGAQDIVRALPQLRQRHPGLRLVLAGDGPYRPELEQLIGEYRLGDAVSVAGFLGPDLPATLAAADAVIEPSIYEPFGLVALEAAAAGTPVAVARTGGLAEIIEDGRTGAVFTAGDPDSLAAAVGGLLADPAAARALARSAHELATGRYSWTAVAARTAAVYGAAILEAPTFDTRHAANLLTHGPLQVRVSDQNLLQPASR